jgi:23S rRNA (uracil1939-C5)-methyltransferase
MNSVTINLTDIANGGAALGRDEKKRVIFVPLAIPGERVQVELVKEKKRFAHGRLLEVLEPSPDRVKPPCPHYGLCGGCHFQHINYPAQLDLKRDIIIDQLTRIGGIEDPVVRPVLPNPDEWAYSNYVTFSTDQAGKLGFWSPVMNDVLPVSTCHIILPSILEQLKDIDLALPTLQQLTLRQGNDDSLMAILKVNGDETPTLEAELPISVAQILPDGSAATLLGDSYLIFSVKDLNFRVSATSFNYPSPTALGALIDTVIDFSSLSGAEDLLELYSGVGTLTAFLAPEAKSVIGIEADSAAISDAAVNLDPFDHVALYEGAVEEILPSLDLTPDVIIMDPPTSGLAPSVHDDLARMRSPVLIYIGSDMATLARDSKRLAKKGYDLVEVQTIDMYPQNYRVLAAAKWQLKN